MANPNLQKQKELERLERQIEAGNSSPVFQRNVHNLSSRWNRLTRHMAKRALDIFAAGMALICLSPILLATALAVKLYDRGPILFWQERVGKHGKVFRFPKFRSMVTDSEKIRARLLATNEHGSGGVTFKMENDPRITPVGRIIRKYSIDEMPQLWCVVTGQMSLVGPRPALPSEVALYSVYQRQRLEATPGLTCYWQVSGRSQIPFEQQVELDIKYIRERTFWIDVSLIIKTVIVVLTARGAS